MSRLVYLTPALAISTQGLPNPDKPEIPNANMILREGVFDVLQVHLFWSLDIEV